MKIQHFLVMCSIASLLLIGCGDESSSSSYIDREDLSSSNMEGNSSSSKQKSSSSQKMENGFRAATLKDLPKNMLLNIDGHDVHLATGAKQGLFSFWILGAKASDPDTGKVAVISDFKGGVVSINSKNASTLVINTLGDDYFLYKMAKKKEIAFMVDTAETLFYAVDGGKKAEVKSEQVAVVKSSISKMEDLVGKAVTCESGDTSDVYRFFNGRFVWNRTIGKAKYLAGGFADIHRSELFMVPQFHNWRLAQIYEFTVSTTFEFNKAKCSAEDFKPITIDAEDITNSWYSFDKENNVDWSLVLNKDMSFEMLANNGEVAIKNGAWDIYGNYLFMHVTGCDDPDNCETSIGGVVDDFEKNKGFTFKHSNKEKHAIPTEWVMQEFE